MGPLRPSMDRYPRGNRQVPRKARPIGSGYSFGSIAIPFVEFRALLRRKILHAFQHHAEPSHEPSVVYVHHVLVVITLWHLPPQRPILVSSGRIIPVSRFAFLRKTEALHDPHFQSASRYDRHCRPLAGLPRSRRPKNHTRVSPVARFWGPGRVRTSIGRMNPAAQQDLVRQTPMATPIRHDTLAYRIPVALPSSRE